jgi:hypothetical protein
MYLFGFTMQGTDQFSLLRTLLWDWFMLWNYALSSLTSSCPLRLTFDAEVFALDLFAPIMPTFSEVLVMTYSSSSFIFNMISDICPHLHVLGPLL